MMKKVILLIVLILSIQYGNACIGDNCGDMRKPGYGIFSTCSNFRGSQNIANRALFYGKDYPIVCNKSYYTAFNATDGCYLIKEVKTRKILKSFCGMKYFTNDYTDEDFGDNLRWLGDYKTIKTEFHSGKYSNHLLYTIKPYGYNDSQKEVIGKTEDILGFYVDNKRIFAFAPYKSKLKTIGFSGNFDYLDDIYKFDEYYSTNNPRYEHGTIKAPILTQKSQDKLNKFIGKIPKEKYTKVYGKIDEIRKDYTNMDLYRHRFIKEVLDYIYFEIKVKELMKNDGVSGYMKYHPTW